MASESPASSIEAKAIYSRCGPGTRSTVTSVGVTLKGVCHHLSVEAGSECEELRLAPI
jgi:hypothetical protein